RGAARPISTPRLTHRRLHTLVEPPEMPKGSLWIVQHTQGDPAGEPFAFTKASARILPVRGGQRIGERLVAIRQRLLHCPATQLPPLVAPRRRKRRNLQDLDHAAELAGVAAPAGPVVQETRIVLE